MEQEKKFKLFNFNRDGKGVEKEEVGPPNLKNFFKQFGRKFTRLLSLNLYIIVGYLPLVFMLYLFFTGEKTPSVLSPLYPALWGIAQTSPTPVHAPLFGVTGIQFQLPFLTPTFILTMLGIFAVWLFIFGPINVGTTYSLRSLVRGEPVFMWADFWYAVRRNFKQGLLVGALDLIVMALLAFDVIYFYNMIGSFAYDMMFYMIIALIILYFFMRFYLYLMLITFDLPIRKLIKNAFIFSIVGFKRNGMALLGILALALLNYMLVIVLVPVGIIVPIILPVVYFFGFASFMAAYAAWPKIEELMIKPYRSQNGADEDDGDDGDTLPDPDAAALL